MPDKHFYSYDVKRNSVLKIHDILTTKDKKTQLQRLVYDAYLRHLKQSYTNQKDIEHHLHTWVFYLNENFYFTPQGISFTYAPYELGPYAAGFTVLNIPKNKLIGIIKPRYLQANLGGFNDGNWSQNK